MNIDLYYFGARYYDSETGRFISVDPVYSDHSRYSYGYNSPISLIDVWGLGGQPGYIFLIDGQQVTSSLSENLVMI